MVSFHGILKQICKTYQPINFIIYDEEIDHIVLNAYAHSDDHIHHPNWHI